MLISIFFDKKTFLKVDLIAFFFKKSFPVFQTIIISYIHSHLTYCRNTNGHFTKPKAKLANSPLPLADSKDIFTLPSDKE